LNKNIIYYYLRLLKHPLQALIALPQLFMKLVLANLIAVGTFFSETITAVAPWFWS